MARRLFCFGLGYSARQVAACLAADGVAVIGSMRRPVPAAGLEIVAFGDGQDLPAAALDGVTDLLISIPPGAAGDIALADCRAALERAAPSLRWIGYLSTTGVYGDHGGAWVDETTPLSPTSERARRRADAEQAWRDFGAAHGVRTQIFRLAGIYGPGRNVLADLRAGSAQRIIRPHQVFSRIHVEDIAQVVRAAMVSSSHAPIFNVCDDEPAASADVVTYGAQLLGIAPPPEIPFERAALSAMALSFWADNKKVRNDLMKSELGIRLLYPSYREGLLSLTSSLAEL